MSLKVQTVTLHVWSLRSDLSRESAEPETPSLYLTQVTRLRMLFQFVRYIFSDFGEKI